MKFPDSGGHEQRKCDLRNRGLNFKEISRRLGCTPGLVTAVSQGKSRSLTVETAIAEALGVSLQEAFPERFAKAE